jgi:hypothetical protein
VRHWAKTPASIKEINEDDFRFECPQCSELLHTEDQESIVDSRLRDTVNEEIDKLYENDEDEPLVRVNLNNIPNAILNDLDFLIDLFTRIATNEHVISIVIIGLVVSYILNSTQD